MSPYISKHFLSLVPLHCTEINLGRMQNISLPNYIELCWERECQENSSYDSPPTDGFLAQNSHSAALGRDFLLINWLLCLYYVLIFLARMCPLALSLFIYSIYLACVFLWRVYMCEKIYTPQWPTNWQQSQFFQLFLSPAKNEMKEVRILHKLFFSKQRKELLLTEYYAIIKLNIIQAFFKN